MTPTNCVNAGYLRRESGVQHSRQSAGGVDVCERGRALDKAQVRLRA